MIHDFFDDRALHAPHGLSALEMVDQNQPPLRRGERFVLSEDPDQTVLRIDDRQRMAGGLQERHGLVQSLLRTQRLRFRVHDRPHRDGERQTRQQCQQRSRIVVNQHLP